MNENLDIVRRIDLDRLYMLVSERIGLLKLYARNIDKAAGSPELHDAICRDLILHNAMMLLDVESVNVGSEGEGR